jgi:hypothetical protein
MSNTFLYQKAGHILQVVEVDNKARVNGLKGWIDDIELMTMLLENGYKLIS